MFFRKAQETDISRMMEMVNQSKASMKARGIDQWQQGYPNEAVLRVDLEKGTSYVLEDCGLVVGMITVVSGDEEAYRKIEGSWLNQEPYVSYHRVCVEEGRKGQGLAGILFEEGEKLCREWGFKNIRNDTHPDNRSMQRAVEKFGFERCGIIYIVGTEEDGSPRAAYQKVLND
ncbi:MAG: GNAT family N-acetyltransferase [Clostridiaceae bacterium]|nr:GNAT family N-acetyltransferase [Clostridiaceae bacterium]